MFQYHKGNLPTISTKYVSERHQNHSYEIGLKVIQKRKRFSASISSEKDPEKTEIYWPQNPVPNHLKSISFQSFTSGLRGMCLTASSEDV